MKKDNENQMQNKISRSEWISIANILITILASIVLVIIFKIRDEKFQKTLLIEQAKIQSQSELADIVISGECGYSDYLCNGYIIVENFGLATAENVIILMVADNVDTEWVYSIDSLEKIDIKIDPLTINPGISFIKIPGSCVNNLLCKKENAIKISIETIAPYQQIGFYFSIDNSIKTKIIEESVKVITTNKRQETIKARDISAEVLEMMLVNYSIVDLNIEASCTNCQGYIPKKRILISSLNGFSDYHHVINKLAPEKTDSFVVNTMMVVPENSSVTPMDHILNIQILDESTQSIME